MDISDNSTIGDSSTTIYVNGSYAGDIESGTQSNQYKLLSSAVGNAAGGETLYVSPSGDDNNSGTWDSPFATLSHAIDITETGNIVLLEGIHKVNGLTPDKTLHITGESNATIDASNTGRIMYIYSTGDVTLSNVRMINGYSSESGALIGNAGKLTLINTTLFDSVSNNNGGAIYNVGTLTIINSIFKNNTANLGGAIYSGDNSKKELNVRIVNTTFVDNTALGNSNNKGGGAIYAQASSGFLILENVTFENNKAGKYAGGALYAMQLDNIRISDSRFINNSAQSNEYYGGGAIAVIGGNYQREGTTTITNTLFENNKADMSGGAIFLKGTTLDISNSVLVNSADSNGIFIYNAPTVNSLNSKITANDNWWGSNDNPKNLISKVSTVTLNRWAILTIENDTEIAQGNDVNIAVSLTNYTAGSENGTLSKPITIERNVSVQTSFEEINGVLDNGVYNLVYSVPAGLKLISATVDGQTVVLYVIESQASIELDDVSGKKGSKVNINAQIITSDSQVINDGYINFYIGSKLIGHADVLNNNATLVYLIKEDEGIYNLTVEYVSTSGAFNASNVTKTLNVSGLNNIVREDNFYEFFDEDGIIRDEILFDELIFEGEFNNVPQIITIDNPIKITGDNAVLNNIVFMVMADDVELNNLTFIENQSFINNYGSVILVTSSNVSLVNNKINYNAPKDSESYVIYADGADELKLINNEITFTNELTMKELFTNAIYITASDDVLIKNNTMDITIPSVDIDYDDKFVETVYSEGIVLEDCDNVIISENNIDVKYNDVIGNLDTLRAVDIKGSDNVTFSNNTITIGGHKYAYALVFSGNDFNIYNNSISATSDINYANAININGPASGVVKSNTVSAIALNSSYPIYSASYSGNVHVEYENNTVYGNANDVYGIYVSGNDENLTNNEVLVTGNFTIGIASSSASTVISNNTIYSLASNMGQALNLDEIPCDTSGITSIRGNNIVDDNIIETTGKYSVNIQKGQVTNNYLIANNTYGDNSVYPKGTSVLIENNIPLMKTANLTVNNISLNVGDEITFNVTLTDADNNPLANYTVDLNVNGSEYHVTTDKNGIATFEIDSLPEGIYEMEFIVDSKDIIELIQENAILNITLNNLNVNVTASNIREGEDLIIDVTVPDNLDEDLIIKINNSTYLIKNSDSIVISDLSAGDYSISVYYPGDDYYKEYNDEFNVTVYGKDEIVVDINEPVEGEDLIIDVNGPKDITGNVTISVGNEKVDVPFVNGNANLTISNISKGFYPITIDYPGDGTYDPYSFEGNVTVNPKVVPKENLTLEATADSITVGDNATVVVTGFEDATGNVTVTVGDGIYSAPIVDGTATVVVPGLIENVTAIIDYPGDDKYNNASTTVDIVVYPKPKENATIEIDVPEVTEGENATVTVTLPEDATGTVTIGNEVVPVQNGTASAVLTNLPVGNTTVPVTYSGDDKYNPIETNVTVTVDEKPVPSKENLTLEATADSITVGDNATVVVTGFEDATGNVTVTVNGKTYTVSIEDGEATVVVPGLIENVTAIIDYPGDDKYNNASTTVDIVVYPKPKENATIDIEVPPVTEGENATVTVTLPEDATGTVTIGNEVVPVQNGTASAVLTNLPVGNTTVPVTYSGDDKYNNASTTVDIVVNPKPKENATIDIEVPPVTEGQNTTINVELPKDATGTVSATVNNETFSVPVKDGKATITIPDLAAGNYTVPVTYSGDDKYNSLTEEVNITVDEDKSDIIKAPDVTKYFSGPERFVVTVTDYQGNPLANKSVTIGINGRSYDRTTDANGTASIALGLNSGVYNVTVTVDNKTINSVVTILSTVNGTDIVKIFRNATQYYATFRDGEGNYLKDGETVRFNINGVMYDRKVSGNEGLARLNINLEAGEYVITAMNLVTGDRTANNITVLSRITENADLTKYYRNASQYTVKVLGEDGKAVGAGESVTFNINGVFYTRQTDANGIAKININLQPGDYVITAEYKGSMVSNNIKVLPILNASDITMKYRDGTQFKATLVDGQGKPYAGQSVTFNINGVFYNRATDSTGTAKLNINLMPGEYIITSSYNGSSIANTIKISA